MMFTLIFVGIFLRKKSVLPENADKTMAKLETFIFVPALLLFNQMTRCTVQTFRDNAILILYGLVVILCAILVAYLLSGLFVRNASASPEKNVSKKYL